MRDDQAREALRKAGIADGAEIRCIVEWVRLEPFGTFVRFRLCIEQEVRLVHVYKPDQSYPEEGTKGVIRFEGCPCGNPLCLSLGWSFQPRRIPTSGEN